MRVIFMGSPEYALSSLDQLLSSSHQVVAVVTQPDRPRGRGQKMTYTPVKERALEKGIPVFQPEKNQRSGFYRSPQGPCPGCDGCGGIWAAFK